MPRTLTEDDIQEIATRVAECIAQRLATPPAVAPAPMSESPWGAPAGPRPPDPKLAYTIDDLCKELSLSRDSITRLEASGRLRAMPGIRRKIYGRAEVMALLRGDKPDWLRK